MPDNKNIKPIAYASQWSIAARAYSTPIPMKVRPHNKLPALRISVCHDANGAADKASDTDKTANAIDHGVNALCERSVYRK